MQIQRKRKDGKPQNWIAKLFSLNTFRLIPTIVLVSLASLLFATPLSGSYTVGSTGTYKTISEALDSLQANGISGSVVLLLQAQSFTEQIEIKAISGASVSKTITIKGQGDSTKIVYAATSSNQPIINVNGAKHIIIDSVLIESTGNYGNGINFMNAADSNTVRHCHIVMANSSASYGSAGISNFSSLSGSGDAYIKNLNIHDNTVVAGSFGIRLTNTGSSSNYFSIDHNSVTDFGVIGVQVSGCIDSDITNNSIYSGESTAKSALSMWPTAHSVRIVANTFDLASNENHTRVLQVANAPGGGGSSWSEEILVANNFVSYHGTYNGNMTGIYTKHVNYLSVHNNTVFMDSATGSKCLWFDALNSTNNIESKNNNLVNVITNGHTLFVHGSVSLNVDYNNHYGPNGYRIAYHGTNYTSLSAYQSGATQGANSMDLNPDFVSATDYHINTRNSAFDNLGTYISTVTSDIDGDTRNANYPDIGADEFKSGADITVTRIEKPVNCRNATPAVPVDIWVKNLDSKEASNFTLSYVVNGGTPVTENYTGTIKAKDSVLYSFSQSAVMRTAGIYSVVAYSSFRADEVLSNDTASTSIAIKEIRVNLPDSFGGCSGSDIVISPGSFSKVTYLWSDNSTANTMTYNSTNTGRTKHWVQITDANGCNASDTFQIVVSTTITESLGSDTTLCAGDEITFSLAQSNGAYQWSDGSTSNTFQIDSSGTYSVRISTGFQCVVTDSIDVYYFGLVSADLGTDKSICDGDSLVLQLSESFDTYVWQDGSQNQTFTAIREGLYWVDVSDSNGCFATDSLYLSVMESPEVHLGLDTTFCDGGSLTMDVTQTGFMYLWQDNSNGPSFTATESGWYSVTVSISNNCKATDSLYLTVNPLPIVDLGTDTAICEGTILLLDATLAGATYMWQDGSDAATMEASLAGKYSVQVTDSVGCDNSDELNLSINPAPSIDLGRDTFLYVDSLKKQAFVLTPGAGYASYLWSDSSDQATLEVDDSYAIGEYSIWVEVEDEKGCLGRDTIGLRIDVVNSVSTYLATSFKLYPNPNNGHFTLAFDQGVGAIHIDIYSIDGQFISSMHTDQSEVAIDVSAYPKGVYVLEIRNNQHVQTGRVLVR